MIKTIGYLLGFTFSLLFVGVPFMLFFLKFVGEYMSDFYKWLGVL
jgi:hypothetical protein